MEGLKIQNKGFVQETVLSGHLLTNSLELSSLEIVRLLHRSVITFKHTDHHGNTALHLAVRSGETEYVTEILRHCEGKRKRDLDAHDIVYGWTPLVLASARGDLAILELLLRAGPIQRRRTTLPYKNGYQWWKC